MTGNTKYLITIGEPEPNTTGIMADEFEETLIFVGRTIERLNDDDNFIGKYIYVEEHVLSENGTYVKQDGLFNARYLIEK
jgi:hypothetical protein